MKWKILIAGFAFSLAAVGCGGDEPDDANRAVSGASAEENNRDAASQPTHAVASDELAETQTSPAPQQTAAAIHPGKEPYARCAACHLPDGAGIPSTFPPLGENIVTLASSAEGREYLTMAVKAGLVGAIEIEGQQFMGAMPAQHPGLDEAQITDVLNYILEELNDQKADPDFRKFTIEETSSTFAKHANVSMGDTRALRQAAIEAMNP